RGASLLVPMKIFPAAITGEPNVRVPSLVDHRTFPGESPARVAQVSGRLLADRLTRFRDGDPPKQGQSRASWALSCEVEKPARTTIRSKHSDCLQTSRLRPGQAPDRAPAKPRAAVVRLLLLNCIQIQFAHYIEHSVGDDRRAAHRLFHFDF